MSEKAKNLTKSDFIKALSEELNIPQTDATKHWSGISDCIGKIMKTHDELRITGFGTFKAKDLPARKVRSPRDGSMIDAAAKRQVRFSAGAELKNAING